jgi:hypothetical protein
VFTQTASLAEPVCYVRRNVYPGVPTYVSKDPVDGLVRELESREPGRSLVRSASWAQPSGQQRRI